MQVVYPAHIRISPSGEYVVQTVTQHLRGTAQIAADLGKPLGLKNTGYLLGLIHDLGKFKLEFKHYIEHAVTGGTVEKGSVNHSFAAVQYLFKTHKDGDESHQRAVEMLAYACGAHHGLFDCVAVDGTNGFEHRMNDPKACLQECIHNFYEQCADQNEIDCLINYATSEITSLLDQCKALFKGERRSTQELYFIIGEAERLLVSILIDADRRDTAAFMTGIPDSIHAQKRFDEVLQNVEKKLQDLRDHSAKTKINRCRTRIADICRTAGKTDYHGVLKLSTPTGAGKTICSLLMALTIAATQQKKRVIFTTPLLSILEQNANVIREYIGCDDIVLEHHSNMINPRENEDIQTTHEWLTETWQAPIIITTMVQLLNTFFLGKTSSVRRFHTLSDSVIVMDEVQNIPIHMLSLFNMAISFLSSVCGATIVQCSATQPYLEKTERPPLVQLHDIVPYDDELWAPFRRTKIIDAGSMPFEQVIGFVAEKARKGQSLLVICNTKSEAAKVFQAIHNAFDACFHLSAAMCPAHRREVLAKVRERLAAKKPVVLISTQVIEAGVDISFSCVIRFSSGMDSIVQAAGRCNRNGQSKELAPVYIVNCSDEQLEMLREIKDGKSATVKLLNHYKTHSAQYDNDLTSDQAIRQYYSRLYEIKKANEQDFMTEQGISLFSLYANNTQYRSLQSPDIQRKYFLTQAFKEAGRLFTVFGEETKTVIVPWRDGSDLCDRLLDAHESEYPLLLNEAKPYAVSCYDQQIRKLRDAGGLIELADGAILLLQSSFYDSHLGQTTTSSFLEV